MTIEEKAKETIPDAFDNDEILPVREGFISIKDDGIGNDGRLH